MKASPFSSFTLVNLNSFCLMGITAGLAAIHLTLTWKAGEIDHLGMSAMFWLAAAYLLYEKRHDLQLNSTLSNNFLSSGLGWLTLVWVLLYSTSLPGEEHNFLRLSPFVSAVGLSLLASGFYGLKQFSQELIILFFLGIPRIIVTSLIDISPITAKFSAFLLWYLGFEVSLSGTYITLANGSINVYSGCSGIEAMTYLLGLAAIFLVMFPMSRLNQLMIAGVAVAIAFVVNAIRVALMAVLTAYSHQTAFTYWHEGDGSMIFAMMSVICFGLFCFFILRYQDNQSKSVGDLKP